jgi:hypothetical protein
MSTHWLLGIHYTRSTHTHLPHTCTQIFRVWCMLSHTYIWNCFIISCLGSSDKTTLWICSYSSRQLESRTSTLQSPDLSSGSSTCLWT